LRERRGLIAEVLAALQRIGRQTPPALMIRAEDALQSVRSAMMLGAVLPEMRHQAEVLATDLAELVRLRTQIADERSRLARDLLVLVDERQRLSLFTDERQKRLAEAERTLGEERQHAAALAVQAENLNQLIVKLEQGLDSAARSARAAARSGDDKKGASARPDFAALKDPGRLSPAISFASAKGMLPLPVNGAKIREFGAPDGVGGTEKGVSIAARPEGQITAPCDGWVVYAGPFRNYGQLLILNAGGGYHVLLAGMERISVDLGQFVVTGEPVAVMGSGAHLTADKAGGTSQPVLYVEFRKDGIPVDPGPWWAANEGQKVRG
jgi:septal ring factor EnvC (AmiA/AmiB activator)